MVCYRRYGHNESDEPAFTQPRMYGVIANHRSVRKLYTELLVNRGDLTLEEAEHALDDFRSRMEEAFDETKASERPPADGAPRGRAGRNRTSKPACRARRLDRIVTALTTFPEGFEPHPKLARILANRRTEFDTDKIDWALAEALAFGSLLLEGTPVRVAGQDTRRGTFSQRHAVVVDHNTEQEYTPLDHLGPDAAAFMIYDSVLSEFAALGFEYGYSVADTDAFVAGKRSSATSRTAARSSSTSSSSPPKTNGASAAGSHCCSLTATKVKDPNTVRRASNDSSCSRRRTTSASCIRPRPRSTSTCCAARCTTRTASR